MKTVFKTVVELPSLPRIIIHFQGCNTYLIWEEDGLTMDGLAVCGFGDLHHYNRRKGVMEALRNLIESNNHFYDFDSVDLKEIRTILSDFVSDEKIDLITSHPKYQTIKGQLDFQNGMVKELSRNCQYFKTDGDRKNMALSDLMIENLQLRYGIKEFPTQD